MSVTLTSALAGMNQDNDHPSKHDNISELRLEILLDGVNRFKLNDHIIFKAWITNIGSHTVTLVETHILREYEIRVMFENGQLVPMTTQGIELQKSVNGSEIFQRMIINLDPGSIHQIAPGVDLTEWFQLDKPSTYIVNIRSKSVQEGQPILISNLVTFVILENNKAVS